MLEKSFSIRNPFATAESSYTSKLIESRLHIVTITLTALTFTLWPLSGLLTPPEPTYHSDNIARTTVAERLDQYGAEARDRWRPFVVKAGVTYPPRTLYLVGLKTEKQLEVYGESVAGGAPRFIRSYPILAASGDIGPKLREGDLQVPEGLYRIDSLNPNSAYHLSLRINYPNNHDRNQAAREGRKNLGGDIMIHGNQVSIGCLAMGDSAAEDLFVIAADTGLKNIRVVLSPIDFRTSELPVEYSTTLPSWVASRYAEIRTTLAMLRRNP